MSFDISAKEAALVIEDDGLTINILDENDEPAVEDGKPVTWTVCGMNSKQYRRAELWQRRQYQSLGGKVSAEQQVELQSEFVARCSKGYSDNFTDNGAPLPFSVENATKILSRLSFVQRQVEKAIGDRARFLAQKSRLSASPSGTTQS